VLAITVGCAALLEHHADVAFWQLDLPPFEPTAAKRRLQYWSLRVV
jgi:hypothetical protein